MRPLGSTQEAVLRSLRAHRRWHPGCGWLWDTASGTVRILDSLVKRGLVRKDRDGTYWPVEVTS